MACCGKQRKNFQEQVAKAKVTVTNKSKVIPAAIVSRSERIKLRQERIKLRAERIARRNAKANGNQSQTNSNI